MLQLIFNILKSPRWLRLLCFYPFYPLLALATKKKVKQRILKVFPDMPSAELAALAKKTIKINFDNVIHLLGIPQEKYQIHGQEKLMADQPAVVATLHTGRTDAATWALQQQGFKTLTIIGDGRKSQKMKAFGHNLLKHIGLDYVVRKKGLVFQLIAEIKQNKVVFIHSDFRGNGPNVEFCGHKTDVPGTAASLSVLANAPLLFAYSINQDGVNHIFIEEIPQPEQGTMDKNESINFLTQKIANAMENVINKHPEHWFWFYNRFK